MGDVLGSAWTRLFTQKFYDSKENSISMSLIPSAYLNKNEDRGCKFVSVLSMLHFTS